MNQNPIERVTVENEDNCVREITEHKLNGLNEAISIRTLDKPGPGGANHVYEIELNCRRLGPESPVSSRYWRIAFQKGPVLEAGYNGISNEALLAIVIDRLKSFQAGEFCCNDNAVALTHIETALLWLKKRTQDRIARGVEGTLSK